MGRMMYWQNNWGGKDLFLAFKAGTKVFFGYEWVERDVGVGRTGLNSVGTSHGGGHFENQCRE